MAVITGPVAMAPSFHRNGWRSLDWVLLLLVLAISVWSCFAIFSATRPPEDAFVARPASAAGLSEADESHGNVAQGSLRERLSDPIVKQVAWILVGAAAILLVAFTEYHLLMHLQFWIYIANIGLLLLVLVIGREVNGAKSWIPLGQFRLQPAELAKVAVIVTLAAFLCRRQERIRELPTLLWSLVYLGPPLLLILKQPDFGTMLSVLSIWFGMLFFGGARIWHLAVTAFVGIVLFVTAWQMNVLKPHQKERLAVFLDADPSPSEMREGGYQIKQSQIAIGAGQISGQGFGKGMQNRSKYVPENDTDFIFTVVAEELGFIGGAGLLMLYLCLLFRSAMLATTTDNYFGVLIAGGFTSLIAFHTIVNLGMTMRVMPITGVPLPFFSYGGSSYLAFSLCVGLLQSIALRSKRAASL
jgi:rod shape determining protein RodA